MTIDVLRAGLAVQEIPCDLRHRATGRDIAGQLHRAGQYRDVLLAVGRRRVQWRGVSSAIIQKAAAAQRPGEPYRLDLDEAVTG